MTGLYALAGPLLRLLDPERAHGLALTALKAGLVPRPAAQEMPILSQSLWGLKFSNPLGLAAGFDKNGEVVRPMLRQGFGFVEVGSVTPRAQDGNPRPRLFRLTEDRAVINRMGFNNHGADVIAARLRGRERAWGIAGVNLGANKDSTDAVADYAVGAKIFAPLADYLVVNISSPNTPGLRALQGPEPLQRLLSLVKDELARQPAAPPLLLKVAPDLTAQDKQDIARVALETEIDGLIATNTTIERPPELQSAQRAEAGGLSGRPLRTMSSQVLSDFYRLTEGRLPLIGVGGVESGRDAYAKIRAGASLVQLYSALVFHGPGLAGGINRELAACLRGDGFANIADAVGADHR